MKVSLQLPTGVSLTYNVEEDCTLKQLQKLIRDSEGIPEEMQNYVTHSNSNSTNWHKEKLTELFPDGFSGEELKLQMLMGPLPGAGAELDCFCCGCGLCNEGKCFAHVRIIFFILPRKY